jgi:hypothetical protein
MEYLRCPACENTFLSSLDACPRCGAPSLWKTPIAPSSPPINAPPAPSPPPAAPRDWRLGLLFLALAAPFYFMVYYAYQANNQDASQREAVRALQARGKETQARVLKTEPEGAYHHQPSGTWSYSVRIAFQYEVDGKQYQGEHKASIDAAAYEKYMATPIKKAYELDRNKLNKNPQRQIKDWEDRRPGRKQEDADDGLPWPRKEAGVHDDPRKEEAAPVKPPAETVPVTYDPVDPSVHQFGKPADLKVPAGGGWGIVLFLFLAVALFWTWCAYYAFKRSNRSACW